MSRRIVFVVLSALVSAALACSALSGGGGAATPGAGSGSTPGSGGAAQSRSATLSELQNTVDSREEAGAKWKSAVEGESITTGGGARTQENARAKITISDGTLIRMAPATTFNLTELSPEPTDPVTRFVLEAGKVWVSVTEALGGGSFEIETPTGVAAVRGSLMSAEFYPADGRMIVTCLDGACRLTAQSGQFVDLSDGEQSGIPGYGQDPGAVITINIRQLNDWANEFPEAAAIVGTITPGPPPTQTPAAPGGGAPGGGVIGSVGQTACDHPYFPMRAGATWTYSAEGGAQTWTINSVQGDATSAAAEMSWSQGDVSGTYNWQCDASGIVSYQFGSLNVAGAGSADYSVTSHSGTFLPPAELLVPGYGWENAYTIEYTFTGEGQTATSVTSVAETLSVAGNEPVSVGGEQVEGLQIAFSSNYSIQVSVAGQSAPPTDIASSGTYVLARGVGIVSITSVTEGGTFTTELTSFSIP
jgi:hypothetical protein